MSVWIHCDKCNKDITYTKKRGPKVIIEFDDGPREMEFCKECWDRVYLFMITEPQFEGIPIQ